MSLPAIQSQYSPEAKQQAKMSKPKISFLSAEHISKEL